jgi:hypothetical protein
MAPQQVILGGTALNWYIAKLVMVIQTRYSFVEVKHHKDFCKLKPLQCI